MPLVCLVAPLSAEPALRVYDGTSWQEWSAEAWAKLPRAELTAKARDGQERRYAGVPLAAVLKALGAPSGETLRGGELNRVVLFTAADGYRVVFSLAELDAGFREQEILLADRVDGAPLSDFEGPYMVVAKHDRKHSRWIRQVKQAILARIEAPQP